MATAKEMIAMLSTLDPETQLNLWAGDCCQDETCKSNYVEATLLRITRGGKQYYSFAQDVRVIPMEPRIEILESEY